MGPGVRVSMGMSTMALVNFFFHFFKLQTQNFQSRKSLINKSCLNFLLILPSPLITINS